MTVQRSLGHAKATTTLNTYAHLWPTAEDRTQQGSGVDHVRVARRAGRAPGRVGGESRLSEPWPRIADAPSTREPVAGYSAHRVPCVH